MGSKKAAGWQEAELILGLFFFDLSFTVHLAERVPHSLHPTFLLFVSNFLFFDLSFIMHLAGRVPHSLRLHSFCRFLISC